MKATCPVCGFVIPTLVDGENLFCPKCEVGLRALVSDSHCKLEPRDRGVIDLLEKRRKQDQLGWATLERCASLSLELGRQQVIAEERGRQRDHHAETLRRIRDAETAEQVKAILLVREPWCPAELERQPEAEE